MVCHLQPSGRTHTCLITMQYPTGGGFGPAARDLARRFRTTPGSWPNSTSLSNFSVVFTPFTFPAQNRPAEPLSTYAWLEQPSPEAVAAGFPATATRANVAAGVVILRCAVGAEGWPTNCQVESESTPNVGLAAAALHLAPGYRMTLWTADGRPNVGQTITLTIPLRP